MEVPLIGIIITLIFSAFFSGMEIAFISSNRLKIELDKSKGTTNSKILNLFYSDEPRFIAMLLLGNNVALVFFGLYSAETLSELLQLSDSGWGLLLQTVISTVVVLIVAEFLPKTFVQMNPNAYLKYTTIPMVIVFIVMFIPTYVVVMLSNVFLKLLRVDQSKQEKVFSKVDLEHFVQDINDRIEVEQDMGNEMQILQNALDFGSVKARDCMVPRTDIISVEIDDDISDLRKKFIDSGKSKIVVYRESIDNIIGYVHSFEMFKSPEAIKQILLPIPFVPEAVQGQELLELFTEKSWNMAVVVDEYGGTAGIVTIEDVIEEIFGEIEDEHDKDDWLEEAIDENTHRFSARIDIDYLNEEYEFALPTSEEYETLGGLIIHELESIPEAGTELILDGIKFDVEQVSGNRIEVIRVQKL